MMAQGIENISRITGENSLASAETAQAVEQLSQLASELQGGWSADLKSNNKL